MEKIIRNLQLAEDLINGKDNIKDVTLREFRRIYPFANENLKACFAPFDLTGKKVLSVQASSDPIFELFLKGAREIDVFDINPLTEDYFYLKETAFQQISLPEFEKFFCLMGNFDIFEKKNESFNLETYEKLSPFLSKKTLLWEELFSKYNPSDIRKYNHLFSASEEPLRALRKTVSYFTIENYQFLKEHLSELKYQFTECNVTNLPDLLTETYDFIYLSNIIRAVPKLEEYKKLILKLSTFLNPKGHILVGYFYEIERDENAIVPRMYEKEYRDQVFWESEFSYFYFPMVYDLKYDNPIQKHDACLIYTKN